MDIVIKDMSRVKDENYDYFQDFVNFLNFKHWYDEFNFKEKDILRNMVFYDESHFFRLMSYKNHNYMYLGTYAVKSISQMRECIDYINKYYCGEMYFDEYVMEQHGDSVRSLDYKKLLQKENYLKFFDYINYVIQSSKEEIKKNNFTLVDARQFEKNYIMNYDDTEFDQFDECTKLNKQVNTLQDSYNLYPNQVQLKSEDDLLSENVPMPSEFFYESVSKEGYKKYKKEFLLMIMQAIISSDDEHERTAEESRDLAQLSRAMDIFNRKILR